MHNHHHEDAHSGLAELLDLDGGVLHSELLEMIGWISRQAPGPAARVVDLGAGTGTGTIALAERFGAAEVSAVDKSEQMLARIRAKALDRGLAARVRTVQADLDQAWPGIEGVDLVWASNSLHEMADPDRVFHDALDALRPGGLLAVIEMDSPPRFLPEDIGTGLPGLETRYRAVLDRERQHSPDQPRLGPDWAPNLARVGFTLLAKRTFTIDLAAPRPGAVGRYTQAYLRRIRPAVKDQLSTADLTALDVLAGDGPGSARHRTDLVVRGSRTAWLARRP